MLRQSQPGMMSSPTTVITHNDTRMFINELVLDIIIQQNNVK